MTAIQPLYVSPTLYRLLKADPSLLADAGLKDHPIAETHRIATGSRKIVYLRRRDESNNLS